MQPIILCVDDERTILDSLRDQIGHSLQPYFQIEIAESGQEALEVLEELNQEGEVVLAISDYIMPHMRGDEFLIRLAEQSPRTVQVMLTGQADAEAVGRAVNQASLYRYMSKPWNRGELEATVLAAAAIYYQNKRLEEAEAQAIHAARLAGIGEVAASVAHDVKNPLGVIQLIIEHQLRMPEVDRKELEKVLQLVEKCNRILQQILKMSRKYEDEPFQVEHSLNQILSDSFLLLGKSLQLGGITITRELASELPPIRCRAAQLEQVFVNLLSNARDAMEHSANRELTVRTYRENSALVAEVADTGCGIPADKLDKIFESFYTTKSSGKGTGLGMAISRRIVEEHGGQLTVESQINQGTCFRVRLPISRMTPA
jgi:signal transduction histidine kinase